MLGIVCIFAAKSKVDSTMEVLKHECGVAMVRLLKPLSIITRSTVVGCMD